TLAEHVTAYMADALPHDQREGVDAHLRACGPCRAAFRDVMSMHRLLRFLHAERMPAPMKERLLEEFRRHMTNCATPATDQRAS
ncbi:MAG: zf-HC2 domain-containing protein, partial [Longimicrobiales bacterium]